MFDPAVATANALLLQQAQEAARLLKGRERRLNWGKNARPEQIMPGEPGAAIARSDWRNWLIMAGRGWGKTRTSTEALAALVRQRRARIILVAGATWETTWKYVLDHPTSGLLHIGPKDERPEFKGKTNELHWPNGAVASVMSGMTPERFRGFSGDTALLDELPTWQHARKSWDNLQLGLRERGTERDRARAIIATTPLPIELMFELIEDPATVVTYGHTYDNAANLDPETLAYLKRRYEGTRLGEQELAGQLLRDMEGAMWKRANILYSDPRDYARIVVAVDPAVTATAESDETGIVVAAKGADGHGYVLEDLSCRMSPDGWARRAVNAMDTYSAGRIVIEDNQGGDMIEHLFKTVRPNLPIKRVRAKQGKQVRAEPVAALYEQHRVFHAKPHRDLENQMCVFTGLGGEHDDRVDALVHAMSELMLTVDVPRMSQNRPEIGRRI